jgi:hypothetical protein
MNGNVYYEGERENDEVTSATDALAMIMKSPGTRLQSELYHATSTSDLIYLC